MQDHQSFILFAGSSHPELAQQIAKDMGIALGNVSIETFPDGEIGVQILENVRGRDVFVLQTIARRPNHYLMELLILVDALKRASVRSIGVLLPYYGYARQDRKDKGRVPITAKLVADLLVTAGATRVLTMDLHAEQIQGFFDIPVDHLFARPAFIDAVHKLGLKKPVVVAPDLGSIRIARSFAEILKADLAIVDKRRVSAERVETEALIGSVKDKDVLIVDDIVSTGKTLKNAAMVCKKAGAKRIIAAVTHALLVEKAFEESAIERLLVSNTIPLADTIARDRIEVVSVASLFSQAIQSIIAAKSVSSLFESR